MLHKGYTVSHRRNIKERFTKNQQFIKYQVLQSKNQSGVFYLRKSLNNIWGKAYIYKNLVGRPGWHRWPGWSGWHGLLGWPRWSCHMYQSINII